MKKYILFTFGAFLMMGGFMITHPAHAAFTLIQLASSTDSNGFASTSVTFANPIGAGHLIVVFSGHQSSAASATSSQAISNVSCNGSGCGTWTIVPNCANYSRGGDTTGYLGCAYVTSSVAGATTIYIVPDDFRVGDMAAEYSYGAGNTVSMDAANNNYAGGNTSPSAPSLAASTGSNDLLLQAIYFGYFPSSASLNSGFTARIPLFSLGDVLYSAQLDDYENTASYSTVPTWTINEGDYVNMAGISFKEITGSTSTPAAAAPKMNFQWVND